MKTPKWILCCCMCILTGAAFGQGYNYGTPSTSSDKDSNQTTTRKDHSQKFCRSKDLVGADVKDSQGNKLGDIDEILINPQSGEALASIGVSGGRYALVPVQALNITRPAGAIRDAEVSLNVTKEALQSGPTVAKHEWQKLDDASFVQSIYSHFNLQQPSATGGVSSGSMGGSSSGSESSQKDSSAQPKQ